MQNLNIEDQKIKLMKCLNKKKARELYELQ